MLTIAEVSETLPAHLKGSVTQQLVDQLNQISQDPEHVRAIRDNFISYGRVLQEGKFKLEDYLNAVAYVSYKLMGYHNKEAYERTFPQRYLGLLSAGKSEKDISAYVSAYHKNKLVTMIMEQAIIPSWVLNQDAFQQAINTQMELMVNARSEKVRSDAANSLLTHLKKPETKQVEMKFDVQDNSGLEEMKASLAKMAEMQQALIKGGMSTHEVAQQSIIDSTAKDITPEDSA